MQIQAADNRRERISFVLAAVTVLLGASAFGKVAGYYFQRGRMQRALTVAQSERDPNRLKQCLGEAKKAAETLKKSNLFVKTPPKEHPVKQVEGILGREALIAGKWYKAGDKIADAKVTAINATNVMIEWNGKETSFSPISSATAGPPTPPPMAAGPRKDAGPQPPEAKIAKAAAPVPTEDDPLAWMGVKLSPKARERLLQMWNSAPDDQKEQMKAKWNEMPEEKKQEAVQQMGG